MPSGWRRVARHRTKVAARQLHKAGVIVRLRERRDKCKVYALPEFAGGRETETQGRRS